MAIGKGLNAFLAAYYKAKESESKEVYQRIQLAYLMNKLGGGVPKGVDVDQSKGEKGYQPVPYGLREGRSAVVSDPVSTNMAPHQKAFLNAVAAPESGGEYDRMYAGTGKDVLPTYFEGYDQHPDMGAPGPAGWSTAAGRYMFTKSTWDELGGGKFDPAQQDQRAWALATKRYAEATGGDLNADLQKNGFTPKIASALGSTWTGFKANPQLAADVYNTSINRYTQPQVAQGGAEGSTPSALPVRPTGVATPTLAAAPLPPPRPDNLGQALPVEAGVTSPTPTSPTPTAYAPEVYPQALPVDYAAYDPYNTEAVYAAKGGLVPDLRQQWGRALPVQHFQEGGDVLSDPDPYGADDVNPTNYQALYTGAGDMGGVPTAQPARQINNPISALLDTASDAVTAGVKWLHDKFDVANATLSGVGEHAGLRGLANHEGAAPAGDIQETDDAVDPEKHMNAGARRLAGMNAAYKYYLTHGEETKAKAVAGSMLMYSKQVAAESADMALRSPNYITAAKVLAQGHNQIPGAPQFQVDDNGNYIIKDPKTGKPMDAGVMSPQQVLAAARGMKDGSVFWRTLQTYTKPDEDENKETLPEKKDRLRREAIGGALKTLGLPGATPSGAAPPTAGAIPTAPPPAGTTTATDDDGDTSDEGRSAGTAAPTNAPMATPTPVGAPATTATPDTATGAAPAGPLPKAGMKPAVAAAYTGVPLNFVDTLDTPEKKKAYEDIVAADPRMATEYQKAHERRLAQAAEAAQRTAAANAPAPPPKEAALNQGTLAKETDEAWSSHESELEKQKQPVPPPQVAQQIKFLARNIAKHDPERRSGADGLEAALDLTKSPFGMAGDKIPTSKDGKGPDYAAAMRMLPYKVTSDKDGPFVRSLEDGSTIRMSQEGKLRLDRLNRARIADAWKTQNESTEKRAVSFGPAYDKANDAAYNLIARGAKAGVSTAGDIVQGAKDFGTAWWQRTQPEFQGAANAVAAAPGMIPQNLPGIPQLVQQGIPNVPPGRLPQQVITAGAMNRQPTMVPVAPESLPQPRVGLRDMPWYPIATGPSRQGIPIPRNVPMPNWTLYPNDNP